MLSTFFSTSLISGNNSIWSQVTLKEIDFDFDQLEELFCQKAAQNKQRSGSAKSSGSESGAKTPAVNLLDSKRSLTINIFLRQFKKGIAEVIEKVENAQSMSVDGLRGLLKILPDSDEVSLLFLFF